MTSPARRPTLFSVLAVGIALASGARAQFAVASVSPPRHALAAPTATTVSMTFTAPVDPSTIHAGTVRIFGRWSGVATGSYSVGAGGLVATFQPSRPFFPGELVTVLASAAVAGAGGGNLAGGHTWTFWTRSAPGSGILALAGTLDVRQPGEGQVQSYGVYAGDLDRDGSPDLSIPNEDANDVRVFRNGGCGAYAPFTIHPLPANSTPSPNEGQDFDADGWTDLAVGNITGDSMSLLRGNGAGGYLPHVTYPSGDAPRGLAVLDVEGDGDLDVVTANRNSSNLARHLNAGNGTFLAPTFFGGGGNGETAVAATDANGDGIADLFVGNYSSQTVAILLGDGAGGFAVSATIGVGGSPWMVAVGDVDGDGHVDVATCNSSAANASVARGNGLGGFLGSAVNYATGGFPLAVDLGDLEGDGDLDLAVSNFSGASFTLYRNAGNGVFVSPTTLPALSAGSCAAFVDDDRDGDVDLVGIDEILDKVFLFRQTGPSPPGVQAPSCAATLRIDNLASRAGFAGTPPHEAPIGGIFFAGLSGGAGLPFALAVGTPLEPGAPTTFGLVNVANWFFLLDGFAGNPAAVTDAFGEAVVPIAVPPGFPPGFSVVLQAVVADPGSAAGASLTNPERIVLVP